MYFEKVGCSMMSEKDDNLDTLMNDQRSKILNNLKNDRREERFVDCQFVCKDGSISAHKNILSCGSVYFEKMFKNNFKEASTNEINFREYSMDSTQILIKFIYGEEIPQKLENDDLSTEIIRISHLLQLNPLFNFYWTSYSSNINFYNFLEIWTMAKHYEKEETTLAISEFVSNNLKELSSSDIILELTTTDIKTISDIIDEEIIKPDKPSCMNNLYQLIREWGNKNDEDVEDLIYNLDLSRLSDLFLNQIAKDKFISSSTKLCTLFKDEIVSRWEHMLQPVKLYYFHRVYDWILISIVSADKKVYKEVKMTIGSIKKSLKYVANSGDEYFFYTSCNSKLIAHEINTNISYKLSLHTDFFYFWCATSNKCVYFRSKEEQHYIIFNLETKIWTTEAVENDRQILMIATGKKFYRSPHSIEIRSEDGNVDIIQKPSFVHKHLLHRCLNENCVGQLGFISDSIIHLFGIKQKMWKRYRCCENFRILFFNCDRSLVIEAIGRVLQVRSLNCSKILYQTTLRETANATCINTDLSF